jgi:pyruvate ferredoxin oxidoreductase beta subunit
VKICRLAADSKFWPIYEVINGERHVSYIPKKTVPVEDFLRAQGRYSHLFKEGSERLDLIERAQADIDRDWERLFAE